MQSVDSIMQKQRLAQARIERIIKQFTRDDAPDLVQYISGVNTVTVGDIDDGVTYEPAERKRPEWVAKDLHGWE